MIYWPVTSAIVGISIIFFFLTLLCVLTLYKLIFNLNENTEELTEELLKETYPDDDYASPDTTDSLNNLD